jgi:arylsulfatase A-like enzyme
VPRRPRTPSTAELSETRDSALSAQLALVAFTALLTGVCDAALIALRVAGAAGAFEYVPPRIWIAAPLTWAVVGVLAAASVLPFTRRWSGIAVSAVLVLLFICVRLRAHPELLLLSLGLWCIAATVMARRIQSRLASYRILPVLPAAGVLAVSAIAWSDRPSTSPEVSAGLGEAAPNVVVVFLDTVRYDALFDEEGRVHPYLDTLARLSRESEVFTRAYAPSPWTLPSHLSAVTGLQPHELGVGFDNQRYERPQLTLAERYRAKGYRTAAVISNSFLNAGSGFARGFETFQQAQSGLDVCRTAPGLIADRYWPRFAASVCNWTASQVTHRARQFMTDDERPFFLTLNYMDAHDPYYVERPCGEEQGYRAAIRCLDRSLAPIVDWSSSRRSTILVVLSDHGELFGEHGLMRHGNALYVQLLHVPMMIRWHERAEPRTTTSPLSIAALPALLESHGTTRPQAFPIVALLHPPAAEHRPSEWSALDGSWHLIEREHGGDALYDLTTDPSEEHNLIAVRGGDPAISRLRESIQAMRRSPRPDRRRFRSLGYVH